MGGGPAFSFCTGPLRLCNQPWNPVAVVGSSWATLDKTLGPSKVSFQTCKIRIIFPISLDLTILEIIHAKCLSQHLTHFKALYYQVLTINMLFNSDSVPHVSSTRSLILQKSQSHRQHEMCILVLFYKLIRPSYSVQKNMSMLEL